MEFIIFGIISIITTILLKIIFEINIKETKKIADNKRLDELVNKYPENIEMCKEYLQIIGNNSVKIEEDKEAKTTLYIAIQNKILIANLRENYSRIQTIAHECLHSIQNRKMLMANFIFSNIYLLYFTIITILEIFNILPYKSMFLSILILFSMVYCLIRNFLENDAMIKAKYLAKEYMEKKKISTESEIQEILEGLENINKVGIKSVNYIMFFNSMIKIMIFTIFCII